MPRDVPGSLGSTLTGGRTVNRRDPFTHRDSHSLAGPRRTTTTAGLSLNRTEVDNDQPANEEQRSSADSTRRPIWGLAAPLPHVQRPGMQPRQTETDNSVQRQQSKGTSSLRSNKTPRDSDANHEIHRPHLVPGPEAVPQINVTPSRHSRQNQVSSHHSRPSAETQRSHSLDLLRQATTAKLSTYPVDDAEDGRSSLKAADAVSACNQATRRHRNLSREHVSAHDQADPPHSSSAEMNHQNPPTDTPTHTIAIEPSTNDLAAIESGRRRLQNLADTASLDSGVHAPRAIDWEEYADQQQQDFYPDTDDPQFPNSWGAIRHRFRQPFAEWLGTVVFMTIGLSGSIVHMTAQDEYGDLLTAYLAWGLGVMLGIYIAGGVSGAHLNPAISIVLAIFRGFPWSLCWQYVVAQLLGSIFASAVVYGLYRDAIMEYAANDVVRAGPAFYTQPRDGLSDASAFFTEFVATAIAAGSVLALGDESNAPPGAGMHAFIIGLLITAECMAFSYNTGTALNPARDLGPRLIVWAAGFGSEVITLRSWWFIWGPWCGTISGAIFGAAVYDLLIFSGGESPVNYPSETFGFGHFRAYRAMQDKGRAARAKDTDVESSKEEAGAII